MWGWGWEMLGGEGAGGEREVVKRREGLKGKDVSRKKSPTASNSNRTPRIECGMCRRRRKSADTAIVIKRKISVASVTSGCLLEASVRGTVSTSMGSSLDGACCESSSSELLAASPSTKINLVPTPNPPQPHPPSRNILPQLPRPYLPPIPAPKPLVLVLK